MSIVGRLISYFPLVYFCLLVACLIWLAVSRSIFPAFAFLAITYVLPPLLFRFHDVLFPLRDGSVRLDQPEYAPWWGSHQLQLPYEAVPALEAILRIIPGAYSVWLRLWGSQIGSGVHWTPSLELIDRSRLVVGDSVVFGHKVAIYPHIIRMKGGAMHLTLRKVEIGSDVFVGAGASIGPGARIPSGSVLPLRAEVGVGETYRGEKAQCDDD